MLHRDIPRAKLAARWPRSPHFASRWRRPRARTKTCPVASAAWPNVAGELFLAPQDAPDQWVAIGLNYPVATGDNLWVGNDGRAEIDFGGGQFRLAGDTNLHVSRLDDAQLRAVRRAGPRDRSRARARAGRRGAHRHAECAGRAHASGPVSHRSLAKIASTRNSSCAKARRRSTPVCPCSRCCRARAPTLDGATPQYAQMRNGVTTRRLRHVERRSRSLLRARTRRRTGVAADGGRRRPGPVRRLGERAGIRRGVVPGQCCAAIGRRTATATGPMSPVWGPTWVDYAPWGYAPFHYGRWAYIHGRWGWCPGRLRRAAGVGAGVGRLGSAGPVGAYRRQSRRAGVRLGAAGLGRSPTARGGAAARTVAGRATTGRTRSTWRERADAPPTHYANWNAPGAVTAVPGSAFIGRKPVQANRVACRATR